MQLTLVHAACCGFCLSFPRRRESSHGLISSYKSFQEGFFSWINRSFYLLSHFFNRFSLVIEVSARPFHLFWIPAFAGMTRLDI